MSAPLELESRIRDLRAAHGWSQAELAQRIGISRTGLGAIESHRLVPSVTTAMALARELGVSVEELFAEPHPTRTCDWAWTPRRFPCRYWTAEIGGRVVRYPAEPTPAGELPHDGVAAELLSAEIPRRDRRATLIVAGCDPAASLLAVEYARRSGFRLIPLLRSSRQSLELLKQGLVHVAGLHLAKSETGDGNRTILERTVSFPTTMVRLAEWQEGITVTPGGSRRTVRSLLQPGVRWVGREAGSGARRCLDELFGEKKSLKRIAGDHRGVAEAVRLGWADAGICLQLASEEAGLDFVPLEWESYDLCFSSAMEGDPRVQALLATMAEDRYRMQLADLPGYDTRHTGRRFETGSGRVKSDIVIPRSGNS